MVRDEYNHSRPVSALIRDWLLYNKAGGGGGIIKTVTGNPISVSDALAAPIQSLSVSLSPIQEGSGDPSPDNIRPITGRDSVTVERTGKNLFDESTALILENRYMRDQAFPDLAVSNDSACYAFPCLPNTTYTARANLSGYSILARICYVTVDVTTMTSSDRPRTYNPVRNTGNSAMKITTGADAKYIVMQFDKSHVLARDLKVQLELGSTATAYEPYDGTSVTVQLGQTVYGGNAEIISGQGESTRGVVDLGSLNWIYQENYRGHPVFYSLGLKNDIKIPAYAQNPTWMCSNYKSVSAQYGVINNGTFIFVNTGGEVDVRDTNYSDAASFKAAMSGVQLCYELATPQTLTLDPATLSTLRGDNTVWSDGDDISMTYKAVSS